MTRILLADQSDLTTFGRDLGSGTTLPTTGPGTSALRRGDTYFHTGQGCLFAYTGTEWRQATIPRSDAATVPLYDGMVRDHPTAGLQRSSGGSWGPPVPQAFAVLLGGGANTSIPHNAWTPIALAAEETDPLGGHDNATNNTRWTCPTGYGGWYQTAMSFRMDTGTGVRRGAIRKNGTEVLLRSQTHNHTPASAAVVDGSLPTLVLLAPGDYIEAVVLQDSGSTLTAAATYSSLSLHRVAIA